MQKVTFALVFALALVACDVSDPVERQDARMDPITESASGPLEFESLEAFHAEITRLQPLSMSEIDAINAARGFKSLYSTQYDVDVVGARSIVHPDVADPTFAALLTPRGEVVIGAKTYRITGPTTQVYLGGRLVDETPIEGYTDARLNLSLSDRVTDHFGTYPYDNSDEHEHRVVGRIWNNGGTLYGSSGARTDNYRLRKAIFRGHYYADDAATSLTVECGGTPSTISHQASAPAKTVRVYFDRGIFGTGNDTQGMAYCRHQSYEASTSFPRYGGGDTQKYIEAG